ncbi:MAG: hypothetical protein A3C08_00780 [Candidatus Taylorbacteria bacterium RIFCSPHIGHO2_02_FULL_47_18]|uniref:Uncharacterized protein n=1 Tax=Candidatus Taylorbacteria bacterium RIFCSPLOWO2_01_FULL_48_100 TaxID=1802322 RepID=A0A1G2NEQ7_9BACT|nr:MAG: hypothetical protein A2670_00505 [Candidatus Taylorbacteria bacterium RIFCSPHIGHO2_01_FULL_48_38]OHA27504.1 MAG: hypothetical protein A3C08_00780 [Candidatus Taylorbacteria bacterium RIFCSPHIGHO2_02_FULL_47_18]OHA34567.1 MAG: hypothetical protein A2938_03400 [Candidatus Taylorbacteria bacterium RIFCSPLOWO2_01_FULL_48_100]OHA40331.1 MAG: hypothetical protein A3J31_01875 [Candidatus Taylorbacteria bacterium RIFCSPLOWO2_02_FULL_48_16]OHA44989.1 MAG: hypothetical protein A3H13_03710 [Candid
MTFWAKISWASVFIFGTTWFVEGVCDNPPPSLWLQGILAFPCWDIIWFWGYMAGIAFLYGAVTGE